MDDDDRKEEEVHWNTWLEQEVTNLTILESRNDDDGVKDAKFCEMREDFHFAIQEKILCDSHSQVVSLGREEGA